MIYFNPRLREGGDRLLRPILTQIQISIHASAKEATNSNHFALKLDNYFNPRLREGGDRHSETGRGENGHFNPRLREGGDRNIL